MTTLLATLVALTHTDGRTMEAALVKLGAAHIIVRIGEADARFSRKNGLRINGNHVRGVGYSDWCIGAAALQALTGEPPAATLQAPDEAPAAPAPAPAAPVPAVAAVEEQPAAPAKKERKPRAKKGPALGVPAIAEEPDLTTDPGHPLAMEQEGPTVDQDTFQAPAPDEFPAQLPEMTEQVGNADGYSFAGNPMEPSPVATVAPSAAPEEPVAPAHRDAIAPPPVTPASPAAEHALVTQFDAACETAMCGGSKAMRRFREELVATLATLMLPHPAKAPKAPKPVSDAPKTFRGDTRAKPGALTDLQQKLMRTVGNALAKARREAGDTTPVDAADALATKSPWFGRLAKDKLEMGAQFAADHANEKLKGPASVPPPAKGAKAAKKAPAAAATPAAKKAKKPSIVAGSKVDIKESVREEYADVVGESQMVGLEVLSISGKNARCKTNAGVTLPKVALVDLALAA